MKSFRILAVGLMALSGATCASLSAAGSTYYLNDNLATTVGIADAAGEIAALEADAFGAPMSAGHAPSRYTGKPYDEDMGAYVFPFRNYRPEEARWMSADPSGFPDGVNGRIYSPRLLDGVDPLGLVSKVTQSLFVASGSYNGLGFANINNADLQNIGDSISFSRGSVDFRFASAPSASGWIVQKVDFSYSYKKSVSAATTNWTLSYWEAWGVSILPSGEVIISSSGRDTFETKDFGGTYSGTATITGKAYYVAYSNEIENNPDTWSTTGIPQSGVLPSVATAYAPNWLSSASGITHKLTLAWRE